MFNKVYDKFSKLSQAEKERVCEGINILLWVPILLLLAVIIWG